MVKSVSPSCSVSTRPFVDRALHAQAATRLAPVADADLVDVAVVVDGRAEELRHDHPAGHDHQPEHERAVANVAGAPRGRAAGAGRGGEVEIGQRFMHVQGLASSGS